MQYRFVFWFSPQQTCLVTPLSVIKPPYRSITSASFKALSSFNWLKALVWIYKAIMEQQTEYGFIAIV